MSNRIKIRPAVTIDESRAEKRPAGRLDERRSGRETAMPPRELVRRPH
jgi:hypothetical protein